MDFERKLKEGESETLSFVSSFDNSFEILASISGMSNSIGGEIYIGINSKGKIIGVNHLNIEIEIDRLIGLFNYKFDFNIDVKLINYKYICIVSITECKIKPLSFKFNNDSYAFYRMLNQNYKLNDILFKALKNDGKLPFDSQSEATLMKIFKHYRELTFSKLKSLSGLKIEAIENTLIYLLAQKKVDFYFTNQGAIIYKYIDHHFII